MLALSGSPRDAEAQESPPSSRIAALGRWISETDVGTYLAMRGVRRLEHPRRDDGSRVVTLELRMKPVGEGAQEDLAYLFALDKRYGREHGESLWEKLLFKTAHVLELPRDSVMVSIAVLAEEVLVYADSTGAVQAHSSVSRGVIERVDIPTAPVRSIQAVGARDVVTRTSAATPQGIVDFLRHRFGAARVRVIKEDDAYVDVVVSGMRNVVVDAPRLWERLQLSFNFVPAADRVRITVFADGEYAAGSGTRPPADEAFRNMEPQYARRLSEFVGSLMTDFRAFKGK